MGVETAIIAAAALSATSSVMQGYQSYQYGKYQEKQAQADAAAAQGAANVQADRIRKVTQLRQSSARAALAGSGVNVNTGTALDINSDIAQRGEQDALTAILNGGYQATQINTQGKIANMQGRNALAAGLLDAGSAMAKGSSQSSKWQRMQ